MENDPFRDTTDYFLNFEKVALEEVVRAAKKLDAWAIENPYGAAAVGAAAGLATAIVFNKILALKGAVAIASSAYGAIKGGATGYAYPTVRPYVINGFAQAADTATKVKDMAETAYKEAAAHFEEVGQEARDMFREAAQAARANFG